MNDKNLKNEPLTKEDFSFISTMLEKHADNIWKKYEHTDEAHKLVILSDLYNKIYKVIHKINTNHIR